MKEAALIADSGPRTVLAMLTDMTEDNAIGITLIGEKSASISSSPNIVPPRGALKAAATPEESPLTTKILFFLSSNLKN